MLKIILSVVAGFCVLILIMVNHFCFANNYNGFINSVASTIDKARWVSFLESRFSRDKFFLARKLLLLADVFFIVLMVAVLKNAKKLSFPNRDLKEKFTNTARSCFRFMQNLTAFEKTFIVILLVLVSLKTLWYTVTLPLTFDEMWTYTHYTGNALWHSFYLPGNNHKLYTFIAWWFNLLPLNKDILIRLPNLFAGIAVILLFFVIVRKYFPPFIVLAGLTWFATCCPVDMYMFMARSYIYVLLFTLILLKLNLWLIEKKHVSGYFRIFQTVIIVLGYWANPVFFFGHFFISLVSVFFLLKQKRFYSIVENVLVHFAALFVIAILYLPDILAGHANVLISAAFKPAQNIDYLYVCLQYNAIFQTGFNNSTWFMIAIVMVSAILYFYLDKKTKPLLLISVTGIILLPVLSTVLHNDLTMSKAIFMTINFTILLMVIFTYIIKNSKITKLLLVILAGGILIINSWSLDHLGWLKWSTELDASCKRTARAMQMNHVNNCYLIKSYYKPGIEYYYKTAGKRIQILMSDTASLDYQNADMTMDKIECIITDKDSSTPIDQLYNSVYEDELVNVFIKSF